MGATDSARSDDGAQIVERILVVGGGTAGWMTALALAVAHPRIAVALVESSDVATVGVGEATLNTLAGFLIPNGIGEDEFLARCDGSLKLGIRYRGWSARDYWHPFGEVTFPAPFLHRWMQERAVRGASARTFDDYGGLGTWDLAAAGVAPKRLDDPPYESRTVQYGYHLDAGRLAVLLREKAVAAGVTHLVDHVEGVERGGRGVDAVVLRDRGRFEADLFVDCSGFRSLLLGGALGEPFESFDAWLPNDRAVAAHHLRSEEAPLDAYVTATALSAGWAWTIPLWSRDGTGYVYSSSHLTPAQAEDELMRHLGTGREITNVNHIRMQVGKRSRSWIGNCVAVGLAGGFIEPLESTGLALVDIAQELLIERLANGRFDAGGRDTFNAALSDLYDGIRDFVAVHFVTAGRADTDYWRQATTDPSMVPPRVAEVLDAWDRGVAPMHAPGPFHPGSWAYILDGNGRWPSAVAHVRTAVARSDDIAAALRTAQRQVLATTLPPLRTWLAHARQRYAAGQSTAPLPDPDTLWEQAAARSFAKPLRTPAPQ